jgi:hypothetical protein
MKTLILALIAGMTVALSAPLEAKTAKRIQKSVKTKTARAKAHKTGDLSTNVKFDDSVVHGEYQTPDEGLAKVENEKGMRDLIGVRKHFKDRLSQTAEQQ